MGWVSKNAADPRLSHDLLEALLEPFKKSGLLDVYVNTKTLGADSEHDVVKRIFVKKQ